MKKKDKKDKKDKSGPSSPSKLPSFMGAKSNITDKDLQRIDFSKKKTDIEKEEDWERKLQAAREEFLGSDSEEMKIDFIESDDEIQFSDDDEEETK